MATIQELTLSIQKSGDPQPDWQVRCVAWALHPRAPTEPLAIVAAMNIIYVLHLKMRKPIGLIRGHGGVCFNSH